MENIIIPSTKSLTLTDEIPEGSINEDNITVGEDGLYNYSSYLFFDISKIPRDAEILSAELVLFKTDNFYDDNRKCIYIYPLLDYFSTYSCYNNSPEVSHNIEGKLYPLTAKICTTSNITKIVSLWFKNTLPNKGIILCKKNNNFIASFGSAICTDNSLTPFIKVTYIKKPKITKPKNHPQCKDKCKHNCDKHCPLKVIYYPYPCQCNPTPPTPPTPPVTPTIREVEVVGTVAPRSIYVVIVTLAVTRGATGLIDYYYVTDEYDNSASDFPLEIDKTYSIAVVPQINPGDTEEVSISGSYRG